MIIYKIRRYINYKKGKKEEQDYYEEIIIDNLETARWKYSEQLNKCKNVSYLKGHFGKCELFIPHIFEDGTLAYWPDDENYIEQFEF